MEDNNKKEQGMQIQISPEVARGGYANLAMINHSFSEFVVDFAHVLPVTPPQVFSRVILAPDQAKRLLMALNENISRYEAEFGPIKLQNPKPQGGLTATPFGTGNA